MNTHTNSFYVTNEVTDFLLIVLNDLAPLPEGDKTGPPTVEQKDAEDSTPLLPQEERAEEKEAKPGSGTSVKRRFEQEENSSVLVQVLKYIIWPVN